jgi:hypothetical protein
MAVVLVEGITDRIALEAVAEKLGLDLEGSGIEIVPIGGAQAIRRAFAQHRGKHVVGLCDAQEERWFRRVLGDATYVCVADLEDELIRALGVARVEGVVEAAGETRSLRLLAGMPAQQGWTREAVLRRFLGVRSGRKARYAALLVEALPPGRVPEPLSALLAWTARDLTRSHDS